MKIFLQLCDLLPTFFSLFCLFQRSRFFPLLALIMCLRKKPTPKIQSLEETEVPNASISLLDLPDLVLEIILSKLPPQSLCRASSVSKELFKLCSSDHLWVPHVVSRWGNVAGDMAYNEWKNWSVSSPCKAEDVDYVIKPFLLMKWPLSCLWNHWRKSHNPKLNNQNHHHHRHDEGHDQQRTPYYRQHHYQHYHQHHHHHHQHHHHRQRRHHLIEYDRTSYMPWFATLESGSFWFPAQVYNREHGHVGFLLSCYDAEICYDRNSDTFTARYPPHGSCSLLIEEGVSWHRLRAPPVPATAHELYLSDSLDDLRPGDHVEVQWRRNKRFPYGWWYGVVGHLNTCDKDPQTCRCGVHELVWLEFNQYASGSRWRRTAINRKNHQEKGNDTEGFYAGIRKLHSEQEIGAWKQLWPMEPLE